MIVLTQKADLVDQISFAPTGSLLAVGHNWRYITLWNLRTQQTVGVIDRDGGYGRPEFRFHPTQPGIYHLDPYGDAGEVIWIDPFGNDAEHLAEGTGWPENVLLTHDANRLLVHDRGYSRFRLFDLTNGIAKQPVWSVPVYSEAARGIRVRIEFLPGEDRFFVTENHGNTRTRVSVRSLKTGELVATARFPQRETLGLAISPDGERAVVVSEMSLFVYDPAKLKSAPLKVKNDNRKHFTAVAFHPSGRYLAATSNDATVKLFDTTTWTVAKTYTWDVGRMRSVAFSPDGTLVAAGSDTGKVVVWDVDL